MKLFTMIALLLLIFATSGCALIGLEEEEETETAETGSMDDLQGTWAISCTDRTTQLASFSGTNLTSTATLYWDDTCVNASYILSQSVNNLSPGAKTTLADGTEGYSLSGTYQSLTITPLDDLTTSALNFAGLCEINSWQTNVASDISNKTCGDSLMPKLGTTYSVKYRISGNKSVVDDGGQQVFVYTKQ